MDSKGRPTAADISEYDFLHRIARVTRSPFQVAHNVPDLFPEFPAKVVLCKVQKMTRRGYVNWGVSPYHVWLEEKGLARLSELRLARLKALRAKTKERIDGGEREAADLPAPEAVRDEQARCG